MAKTTIDFTRNLVDGKYDLQLQYLSQKIRDDMGYSTYIKFDGTDGSITFPQEITSAEITQANTIIEDSRGQEIPQHKERKEIQDAIYERVLLAESSGVESGYEQESGLPTLYEQMIAGVTAMPMFIFSLDSNNYTEARKTLDWLLANGIIGQYMYDIADEEIPPNSISK